MNLPGNGPILAVRAYTSSGDPSRFYWSAFSGATGGGPVFYQRLYSEEDMRRRLIEPSSLWVDHLIYVGQRLLTRDSGIQPPITGLIDPILPRVVHTRPVTDWRRLAKPLCAIFKLVKPA